MENHAIQGLSRQSWKAGYLGEGNMRELNSFQLTSHFNLREFQCPCCERVKLHPLVVEALEKLRSRLGDNPIIVTSGYRCEDHNEEISGVPDSDHLYGWAADVVVKGKTPEALAETASLLPDVIKRIGIYPGKNCVHIGVVHRKGFPSLWGVPAK